MDQSEVESAYYLRLNVEDHIGVSATVTKILADNLISISGISQKEARFDEKEQKTIPLVILTHKTTQGRVDEAIKKLKKEKMIYKKIISIPVNCTKKRKH